MKRHHLRVAAAAAIAAAAVGSLFALAQTALGRARFDVGPGTAAVLVVALAGLAVPAMATAWSWLRGGRGETAR